MYVVGMVVNHLSALLILNESKICNFSSSIHGLVSVFLFLLALPPIISHLNRNYGHALALNLVDHSPVNLIFPPIHILLSGPLLLHILIVPTNLTALRPFKPICLLALLLILWFSCKMIQFLTPFPLLSGTLLLPSSVLNLLK